MALRDHLTAIFEADRASREAEARLVEEGDDASLAELLASAVAEARALSNPIEGALRLERLADLCAQVPGPKMADALVSILDHDEPSVRVAAGEALLEVGYERYAELARAIERFVDGGASGPAMVELPFIIAEIGEPSALPLLRKFLAHPDGDVVASAIEASAQLGDAEIVPDLEKLVDDERDVTLEDLEDSAATVGELAEAAIEALGSGESGG